MVSARPLFAQPQGELDQDLKGRPIAVAQLTKRAREFLASVPHGTFGVPAVVDGLNDKINPLRRFCAGAKRAVAYLHYRR
jgi:hypothetical protein